MWKCHNLTQVGQRLRIRHVQGLRSGCYRLFYRVLRLFQCVYVDEGTRSVVVPSTSPQLLVRGSDASGVERADPLSGHRRERAVQRLEKVGVETSTRRVSLSREPAKKRSRVVTTIRLGKDSRSAPRGETQEEKLTPMTSYSRMS